MTSTSFRKKLLKTIHKFRDSKGFQTVTKENVKVIYKKNTYKVDVVLSGAAFYKTVYIFIDQEIDEYRERNMAAATLYKNPSAVMYFQYISSKDYKKSKAELSANIYWVDDIAFYIDLFSTTPPYCIRKPDLVL